MDKKVGNFAVSRPRAMFGIDPPDPKSLARMKLREYLIDASHYGIIAVCLTILTLIGE